ncbi:hypothetical protein NJC38_10900 [Pseudomonas sp. 21LCFQ010]|nr:hypothetical protein [Pseudomonas sp. 21LCFQ010]MCO8162675.1 hypothetical protein [Pseudomonas sp. 21LCFQ010]
MIKWLHRNSDWQAWKADYVTPLGTSKNYLRGHRVVEIRLKMLIYNL